MHTPTGQTIIISRLFLESLLIGELHFSIAHSPQYPKYVEISPPFLFFPVCLTLINTHRIILAQSSSDPWVKSQGSKVITPAQTPASGQIMREVIVEHASLLRVVGR